MLEQYSPLLLVWAFTYFIHSSILIGLAYVIDRLDIVKKTRNAELIWRFALFGALLTASAQIYLSAKHAQSEMQHTVEQMSQSAGGTRGTAATLSDLRYPLPEELTYQDAGTKKDATSSTPMFEKNDRFNQAKVEIELPQQVQTFTAYAVILWLCIALVGCVAVYRSARYLNRLAAYFPDADKGALKHLLNRLADREQTRIQLKISDQWNSPFVTPDNTICIPRWAYANLTEDQRDAMLAHEVAHVLRRDPAWRLAMQILCRVCFFQPLHKVATHKLELLAELACDESAAHSSGKPQELAEALYACARISKASDAPSLALAMSRQGSPLLKRVTSLLDQDLLMRAAAPQTRAGQLSKFSVLGVGLFVLVFTTPSIIISFEKAIPQLQAAAANVKNIAQEVHLQAMAPIIQQPTPSAPMRAGKEQYMEPQLHIEQTSSNNVGEAIAATPRSTVLPAIIATNDTMSENTEEPSIFEANRMRDKKEWQKANALYQMLADKGSAEAQFALGEMYWRGNGVPTDTKIATDWFKKAASNGSPTAEKYLALIREREKRLADIAYYADQYDAKEWAFSEMKCTRPDFGAPAQNSIDLENMIYVINEFASCFNNYGERLNSHKGLDKILPNEIARLMTNEELDRALNRQVRTLATIRLTASLIAEDFTLEKRHWEMRTREYFNGGRSRDWISLKRVALVEKFENDVNTISGTKLVKIDTSIPTSLSTTSVEP